jgi:hypothetical protein
MDNVKKYNDFLFEYKKNTFSLTEEELENFESFGEKTTGIKNSTLWVGNNDYVYYSNVGLDPKGKDCFKINLNDFKIDGEVKIEINELNLIKKYLNENMNIIKKYTEDFDILYFIKNSNMV